MKNENSIAAANKITSPEAVLPLTVNLIRI